MISSTQYACTHTYLVVVVLLEEHLPQEGAEGGDTGTRRQLMTINYIHAVHVSDHQ